jgi:Uncharacterized protein conserved in bacteria (DUF2252)
VIDAYHRKSDSIEAHLTIAFAARPLERVVQGQRRMQAASDIFLGWSKGAQAGYHYYWRQLRDMKGSADVESMVPIGLSFYAGICGWTLARAHARSGDALAITAYLGDGKSLDRAICNFCERYADRNNRDFQAFTAAIDSGRPPERANSSTRYSRAATGSGSAGTRTRRV